MVFPVVHLHISYALRMHPHTVGEILPAGIRINIPRFNVFLLILIAAGLGIWKFLSAKKGGEETEVLTDVVQYNSITSTVEGSGLTKAKDSETITIATTGTVSEVFVNEGDTVEPGTPLFVIDSDAARTAACAILTDLKN